MSSATLKALDSFFSKYSSNTSLKSLSMELAEIVGQPDQTNPDEIIRIYKASIAPIENEMWAAALDDSTVELYQQLFRELEQLIASRGDDSRYKFIITIPVADRPLHLRSCLNSLLTLCKIYNYGGRDDHYFNKLAVIIADDSKEQINITTNREIALHFNSQGIETHYFGQAEQLSYIDQLEHDEAAALERVLGRTDRTAFFHKGSSIMRNITYLILNEMGKQDERVLFYFIDSDQEFRIKLPSEKGDRDLYAINYLYKLDEIFSRTDVSILTGKVVGDPPVSPAVMAGTFLDDVISFLQQIAETGAGQTCQFHDHSHRQAHEAAYHDMAHMFGFKPAAETYRYRCTLSGSHNHNQCFTEFSTKLNHFFYGEHPTRKSYFNFNEDVTNTTPARTIYTGNYIFRRECLRYFIPFGTLKLRMAGPVLGRIIKSEVNDRFVSTNLPMLHKRTVEQIGQSEFRPGINSDARKIDLSGEFERQFFGDVMLFTIKKLTDHGFPAKVLSKETIIQTMETTEKDLRNQYAEKQEKIAERLAKLKGILQNADNWWNQSDDLEMARENFGIFVDNISRNFGEGAYSYQLIDSDEVRDRRHREIVEAISSYAQDRAAWEKLLATRR